MQRLGLAGAVGHVALAARAQAREGVGGAVTVPRGAGARGLVVGAEGVELEGLEVEQLRALGVDAEARLRSPAPSPRESPSPSTW